MEEDAILKNALIETENQIRANNLEGSKAVVKSLVIDAIKTLEDIQSAQSHRYSQRRLREKFTLLHRHLNYLKRFCERAV